MARNFKLHGFAFDPSGSLDVTLSVAGSEVFNGPVTTSTDPYDPGNVSMESVLLSFDLPEETAGPLSWEMTVNGTDDTAVAFVGPLECNKVAPETVIPLSYFLDRIGDANFDVNTDGFSPEDQLYVDTQLGDRLPADVRAKLQAGTSRPVDDSEAVMIANETGNKTSGDYFEVTRSLSNGQLDGEPLDVTITGSCPRVGHSETLTMTADITIPEYIYEYLGKAL